GCDLAGRDLLAVGQLEDAVEPALQLEAVLRPLAEVTAAQPAFLKDARGVFGAAVVALHDLRPADEDLAAAGEFRDRIEPDRSARQRMADHARRALRIAAARDGRAGRGLGEAPALQHRDAQLAFEKAEG